MKRILALDGEEEADITQNYGDLGVRQEWLLRPQEMQPAVGISAQPATTVAPAEIKVWDLRLAAVTAINPPIASQLPPLPPPCCYHHRATITPPHRTSLLRRPQLPRLLSAVG